MNDLVPLSRIVKASIIDEVWVDVVGYKGRYMVSSLGRIRGVERMVRIGKNIRKIDSKILNPFVNSGGYSSVCLHNEGSKATVLVHIIVATSFIPNPENKKEVNHKNGIKTDNRVSELEWNTRFENEKHALESGLKQRGVNHPKYGKKLKERGGRSLPVSQFSLDGNLIAKWNSGSEASRQLKIHRGLIFHCCKGLSRSSGGFIWKFSSKQTA